MRLARFTLVRLLHATDLLILRKKKNLIVFQSNIAVASSMPSSCPQRIVFAAVIPNRLCLVYHMATRGATMMILEIDPPTFPLIIYVYYSWKEFKSQDLPEPIGRIAQTSWPRRTRFKQIFCLSRRDFTYRKCLIALLLVASMSALFDNRCLSPSISHSSSMSPVLEC